MISESVLVKFIGSIVPLAIGLLLDRLQISSPKMPSLWCKWVCWRFHVD